MTLSVGPVTDYLFATAQTAVAAITVRNLPVQVVDGPPRELTPGMFFVGITDSHPEVQGSTTVVRRLLGVGAKRVEDEFTVPCLIDVRMPGNDQKAARDAAESIFNAFWPLVAADLTLGGTLHEGRIAEISEITETPALLGTVAEPGRQQLIAFGVHCRDVTT